MRIDLVTGIWRSTEDSQRTIWDREYRVSEHKFIELQLDRDAACILDFKLHIKTSRQYDDHVGLVLDLGLFGWWFNFSFYDNRHAIHWDDEEEIDTDNNQ